MTLYTLYFDGSCSPKNPGGTATYGFVLSRTGDMVPVEMGHGVVGTGPEMTNNLAEFWAVAKGLECFQKHHTTGYTTLNIYGDSRLVIDILGRRWRPGPDKKYYPGYLAAVIELQRIRKINVAVAFHWIPRKMNTQCDDLSKAHLKDSVPR